MFDKRFIGDDNASGVGAGMAGDAFQALGVVNELPDIVCFLVHLAQFGHVV